MTHQYTIAHFHVWTQLLLKHGISFSQIPRAIIISIITFLLIPFHVINHLLYRSKKKRITNTKDPIFIIGHWRSGTTYLQYLMSKDEQFGYLTYYQAFMAPLIWVGGNFLKRILQGGMPEKRPQDNVYLNTDLPTEEENPLSTMSLHSASHSFYFPKNECYYDQLVLFENITKEIKIKWQKAYQFMLAQIQVRFPDRQLLIKNPHNTGRIKELLEIYPNAKFIYLYRSAHDVIPSTIRMYNTVVRYQYLQDYSHEETENKIFYYFNSILQRYQNTKNQIPASQLIEVSYASLLDNSEHTIRQIYSKFNLELSEESNKRMFKFIEQNKTYKVNQHQIADTLSERIDKDLAWYEDWRKTISD